MRHVLFIFVFIYASFYANIAISKIVTSQIAGLWLFDETDVNVAIDYSGNGNDGKIKSAQRVNGKFEKALDFNGNGYVSIPDSSKLQLSDKFTMQAWFFARDIGNWRQLIAKDNEYLLRIDPPQEENNMSAFISVAGWEPRVSAGVPPLETWTHFSATYDGEKIRVYVNGVSMGEIAKLGNIKTTHNPVEIGRWGGGLMGDDVGYFMGMIDEVAIFNSVLTEDDILESMNGLKKYRLSVESKGKIADTWGNIKKLI